MRRRSNLLVLLGLVAFVLGLLAVYLITSDDDDGGRASSDSVEVLVAAQPLAAGQLGDAILRDQQYRTERVALADKQADALVTPSQLSGTRLTSSFVEGEQLRSSGLQSLGGGRAQIPEGFEAVAITTDFVAGGVNAIIPGDRVNVFFVLPNTLSATAVDAEGEPTGARAPFNTPRAELLLTNTLVLDVQPGTAPLQLSQPQDATGGTSAGGSLIVVLAVDTVDAEKVIFSSTATGAELYLSRVRLDDAGNPAPPVQSTPGVDFGTILAEEAGAAFSRSNG